MFEPASDFDVGLAGRELFASAASEFPNFANNTRVGPLTEKDLSQLGIDTGTLSGAFFRDTKFMIYPDTVELYKRGAGYPLVTRQ